MAIDTANKRLSVLNTAIFRTLPFADGSIGIDDRQIVFYQYAHDSLPVPLIITKQIKVGTVVLIDSNKVGTVIFIDQYKIGDIEFVC